MGWEVFSPSLEEVKGQKRMEGEWVGEEEEKRKLEQKLDRINWPSTESGIILIASQLGSCFAMYLYEGLTQHYKCGIPWSCWEFH